MEKLLNALQEQEVKVTDALKESLQKVWEIETKAIEEKAREDTGNLFTQEDLNKKIEARLARERAGYEGELKELRSRMEKLVEPDRLEEVEAGFKEQIDNLDKQRTKAAKEYELRLAATKAGAKDEDYILFQANKKGFLERLAEQEGKVVLLNAEGNPETDDKGNPKGPEAIISAMKEEMPGHFAEVKVPAGRSAGATNPTEDKRTEVLAEERRKKAGALAAEMGFKKKQKESE